MQMDLAIQVTHMRLLQACRALEALMAKRPEHRETIHLDLCPAPDSPARPAARLTRAFATKMAAAGRRHQDWEWRSRLIGGKPARSERPDTVA